MNRVSAALASLAQKQPPANDVVAGWIGFAVFVVLLGAVVFLGFSLSKHLRRARSNFGVDDTGGPAGGSDDDTRNLDEPEQRPNDP